MTSKLNRHAYEELVAGDVAWLESLPRTLERDHVIKIALRSPDLEYAKEDAAEEVERLGKLIDECDERNMRHLSELIYTRAVTQAAKAWREAVRAHDSARYHLETIRKNEDGSVLMDEWAEAYERECRTTIAEINARKAFDEVVAKEPA